MKINYAIVLLSLCILLSGYWIGAAIKKDVVITNNIDNMDTILSLTQAAKYLKLSEGSIKKIIIQEDLLLKETGSFSGMMFPYIKVYDNYVFSKMSLDEWMLTNTKKQKVYSVDGIENR